MQVITVASQKGGAGKTTLSTHIAVLAQSGKHNVLLIDLDAQKSATRWHRRRKDNTPRIVTVGVDEVDAVLKAAKESGIDMCIIDTPPAITRTAKNAIEVADLCIIPCRPSLLDLDAIGGTIDLIRETKTKALVVLNGCLPHRGKDEATLTKQARVALKQYDVAVSPVSVVNRTVLSTALMGGKAVTEVSPKSKASQEMKALYKFLQKEMAA